MDPEIEKLLITQHRDNELSSVEREIARLPSERKSLEDKIREAEARIEFAGASLKEMEVRRNQLDADVEAKQAQISRYLNQQLEVKKNEEYRALTHEIEKTESEIGDLEEREIGLMLDIDRAREAFATDKSAIERQIEDFRGMLTRVDEREAILKNSLADAQAGYEAARNDADPVFLAAYDRVRQHVKTGARVVEIIDQKCAGCHLRVSNETHKASRAHGEVHFCDQCGRIVYQ